MFDALITETHGTNIKLLALITETHGTNIKHSALITETHGTNIKLLFEGFELNILQYIISHSNPPQKDTRWFH